MGKIGQYLVIYLCAFTGPLAGNAILSMTTELQTDFDITLNQVLLAIPTFMLPFAFFQLFSGTISENWSRKLPLISGMAIYGLSSMGITFTSNLEGFLTMRIGQGFGYAFVGPVTIALLGDITDRSRYGLAMGFYGSAVTAGLLIGPLIGGYFSGTDWRLAFWTFSIISFIGVLLISVIIPRGRMARRLAIGRIAPNIKKVTSNRNIALISAVGALAFFASIGNLSFLSDTLREPPFVYSGLDVGVVLASSAMVGIIVSPFAGAISDRRSPRFATSLGIVIVAPAIALLALATEFYQFILLVAFAGGGGTLIWAGLLTVSIEEIPSLRGTSSSVFNSARFSGYAISPVLLAPIFSSFSFDGVAITSAIILVAALILTRCLAGKACIFGRHEKRTGKGESVEVLRPPLS